MKPADKASYRKSLLNKAVQMASRRLNPSDFQDIRCAGELPQYSAAWNFFCSDFLMMVLLRNYFIKAMPHSESEELANNCISKVKAMILAKESPFDL